MRKKLIKVIGIAGLLVIGGTSLYAWSVYRNAKVIEVAKDNAIADTLGVAAPDTALVRLFTKVSAGLDPNRKEFLLTGVLDVVNGADSTDNMNRADYLFSKKGKEFYFKLGQTEVFNLKSFYLFIDHAQKKVILSKQKQINAGNVMPDLQQMIAQIQGEGFEVSRIQTEGNEQITLSNPHHLSCKEFSLAFDETTLKPALLRFRLSDGEEPENKKRDQVLNLRIMESATKSDLERYASKKVVEQKDRHWVLSEEYKAYDLITMM
ncbi:hypothetical protein PBAL39_13372 [Pedobacter sp. BAL39]|uniref:hypothetical protein n=1 Tax=Pedobacter sp. BAL39 TaxID=391596 RepID=UPI000155995C|nr:hypothetical protein [Pedobacter sp. BAL39]EDM35225.1 hypothetical protein PBAL39_13372 [Pedobacter sp. BAL39]